MTDEDRKFRADLKETIKRAKECSDAEAEVYIQRIADRLAGYTHDEVVAMHPLPAP